MSIKRVVEKKLDISENKPQNQVQITFETLKKGTLVSKTITLEGDGFLKVLTSV